MPFLYGYLQFNPIVTKGVCWSFITLNVSLFVVLYIAQIHKIKLIITESFHAQIICNFLSSTALFVTILIYSYYPTVFIINHKLFDFTTYPYIGIGILTTFNATILLFSYLNFDQIENLYPEIYYGCFVLFYIESCVQCLYFLYLIVIILIDYILGMACNHKQFDHNLVALNQQITSSTHPFHVDFIDHEPFKNIGMSILPGRTKGRFNRDLEADIKSLKDEHRVNVLVTLIPKNELIRCQCQDIIQVVTDYDIQSIYFPFRDKFIPSQIQKFHHFICRLQLYHQANHRIVIHCNGGIGRTGTTTACLLMKILKENDSKPNDISYVSKLMREARRPSMLKNPLQRCFVRTYYHHFCKTL